MPIINESALQMAGRKIDLPGKRTIPLEDYRYPGFALPMEDGRLVTDYRSKCEYNVTPSQYGNSLRAWSQHNADAIIQTSRHRQADIAGAYYRSANTVIPAKQEQRCNAFDCVFSVTGIKDGIGIERDERVPFLFGTFAKENQEAPPKRIFLTDIYEGGRNTPHGRKFTPLGTGSFNPRMTGMGSSG